MSAENDRLKIERVLADRFGMARAVSVGRAALGLSATLRSWFGDAPGARVALSPAVCHDVVVAVLAAGVVPTFCDIDPATGFVEKSEWARARAAGATVAIIVHLYGNPVDLRDVRDVFAGPDCLVIDDAAQALGSITPTGLAGGQGDVGVLSFGRTKQISAGGGALLFRDSHFAGEVERLLKDVMLTPTDTILKAQLYFRHHFEFARAQVRQHGSSRIGAFAGLLAGLEVTLRTPWPTEAEATIIRELGNYSTLVQQRRAKVDAWRGPLERAGLRAVGMGPDAVPWRFTCRLPNSGWVEQYELGEIMRAAGLDVSHWYLPAHWMVSDAPEQLQGAERLAQEVFQFWIDETIPLNVVRRQAAIAADVVRAHAWRTHEDVDRAHET